MKPETDHWQFWLDVGGTFTDCLAQRPDGALLRRKVLSSAVTKGTIAENPNPKLIVDERLWSLPDNFWTGYTFRLLDRTGAASFESVVESSDGALVLQSQLPFPVQIGQPYELQSPEEAPLFAIRLFRWLLLDEPVPPCTVRLGTTRGTNALLTRRGAKTGFVATRGFADILRIGYQNRPKLFELAIKKPEPLFAAVAEIDERIAADGSVLFPPSEKQICQALTELKAAGLESLAICLLNSYANPRHEHDVERVAR